MDLGSGVPRMPRPHAPVGALPLLSFGAFAEVTQKLGAEPGQLPGPVRVFTFMAPASLAAAISDCQAVSQ